MAPKQVDCPRCGAHNVVPAATCPTCGVALDWALTYWDDYVEGPRRPQVPLLLISDPNGFKELYRLFFERLGIVYRLAEAERGDAYKTIELARLLRPDLIITDLLRSDGLQADQMIYELKSTELTYSIPILLMTGAVNNPLFGAALDAGASWYLPKPIAPRDLAVTVASILAGGPVVWIIHPEIDRAACRAMEEQQWRVWTYNQEMALSDPVRMAMIIKPDVIAVAASVRSAVVPVLKAHPDVSGIPIVILVEESARGLRIHDLDVGAESIYSGSLDADKLAAVFRPVLRKFGRI